MTNKLENLYPDSVKCNVLLIGKTGAGKSSFANYLFGTDQFVANVGKPVTGWESNFQSHSIDISGIQVNVYDSVGLEADNFQKWKKELWEFLDSRQLKNNSKLLIANEIMHVLYYVVNAAGGRIEEDELVILKDIQNKFKLPVAIVLTNCDIATEEKIGGIETILHEKDLESVRVCSIVKKTRGGKDAIPMGKEKALNVLLSSSYEKVGYEFSVIILNTLMETMNKTRNSILAKIDNSELSIFNISNIEKELEKIMDSMEEGFDLNEEEFIPQEYANYSHFLENFNVEFQGQDMMMKIEEFIDSIDSIEFDKSSIMNKINSIEGRLENDSLLDKISVAWDIGKIALFMKDTAKDAINEMFDSIEDEIKIVKEKLNNYQKGL